jgi:phosphoribosylformylglycinamidine synthase
MRDFSEKMIFESINLLAERIGECNIITFTGGTGAGDEPGGSAKFITAVLGNEKVKAAMAGFIENRDGLILGIGSGFQALVNLGLVPFGTFINPCEDSPAITQNKTGRFVSRMVRVRTASVMSPWFSDVYMGDIHLAAGSGGEARFVATEEQIAVLAMNGQIASQFVDFEGKPSMSAEFNPGGSDDAIEALTSPDGRILGMLTYPERTGEGLYKNVPGDYDRKIFESGVKYFK